MDKITVITVCYDETPKRICYTFDSIIGQDYPSLECVVVDGGSRADTLAAFEPYRMRIAKFVSEPDRGIYDAMSKGIRNATGEWIIFMNIGDRFHDSGVLTCVMNRLGSECVDILCGDVLRNGRKLWVAPNTLSRRYLCHRAICHQAVLARRRVFDVVGAFDMSFRLVADRDWLFRVMKAGFNYVHVPVVICDWELGGACSDYRTFEQEMRRYRVRYFSSYERILYGCLWGATKVVRRMKSLNFAIPVRLRDRLRRQGIRTTGQV